MCVYACAAGGQPTLFAGEITPLPSTFIMPSPLSSIVFCGERGGLQSALQVERNLKHYWHLRPKYACLLRQIHLVAQGKYLTSGGPINFVTASGSRFHVSIISLYFGLVGLRFGGCWARTSKVR